MRPGRLAGLIDGSAERVDDRSAGDPDVAHLAVDPVGRVVDHSPGDLEVLGVGHNCKSPVSYPPILRGIQDPDLALAQSDRVAVKERQITIEPRAVDRELQLRQLAEQEPEKERAETTG